MATDGCRTAAPKRWSLWAEAKGIGRTFPLFFLTRRCRKWTDSHWRKPSSGIRVGRAATIMMLSSAGQRGDAMRCRELGVVGLSHETGSAGELMDAILTALGTRSGERCATGPRHAPFACGRDRTPPPRSSRRGQRRESIGCSSTAREVRAHGGGSGERRNGRWMRWRKSRTTSY